MTVDPLSLQVFANLFSSVADEMGVTLQQASFSPNIKMRRDFSCAVFDAEGRLLAQAAHIPVHLGAMPMAMRVVRERYALRPGDVVILNDPYAGGTHLPDISLVSAAFTPDATLLGYVMCRAHHADIGGMSPGSMPLSTEIYQEGVIIPPLLLIEEGQTNEALLELLLRNVRTPEERRGDLMAQMIAQRVGEDRLKALADRYGAGSLSEQGAALQSYSEAMMRALISRIPAGEYGFTDYLDGDGFSPEPIPITVTISRPEDATDLTIDFTGSAPPCLGPLNAVAAVTTSATLYVMRCLLSEEVPVNEGSLRPLTIVVPRPSIVGAERPAPVAGGNVETSQRIVDVLFGALAGALPDRVPAASQGTMNNLALGGLDPRSNSPFAYYETMGGGMGARPSLDGMNGVHDHMSNTLNTPVEALESAYPLRVRQYGLRPGSGGRGETCGGEGLQRDLEFLVPTRVSILSERRVGQPYGLAGGMPGALGQNVLLRDGSETDVGGKVQLDALPGDVLSLRSPSGGGIGSLPERETRC